MMAVRVIMCMVMCMILRVIVAAAARIAVRMIMSAIVRVMGVIVRMTVMMIVPVVMMVIVRLRVVSSTFGLEWRVDRDHLDAERREQLLDRRIALHPQPLLQDLHRHVTIAEMPGQPRQHRKVGGARLDQRLGLSNDLDQRAIVEHQRVIGAKPHVFGEIELHAGPFHSEREALLRLPLRMREDQRVDDGSGDCPTLPLGSRLNA